MLKQLYYKETDKIIKLYGKKSSSLIPIIQDIQSKYHYLPHELIVYISNQLKITEAKVYSVATFYENFSFEPKGKYIIKVCDGTACHVRKSMLILNSIYKELKLNKNKHTTDDMIFTIETVSCLGACGLAPTIMINDEVYPKMSIKKILSLIKKLRGKIHDNFK